MKKLLFTMLFFFTFSNQVQAASFHGLGDLSGGDFYSAGGSVSADGSVVVGHSESSSSPYEVFRWTKSGGMVGLGFACVENAVSADGLVIVGMSYGQAFRWTQSGGLIKIGDLPGGSFSSYATGTSADGSVVVGLGTSAEGYEAFRWTKSGGMVGLGDLRGGSFRSQANGVSADGSVVVGIGTSASGEEAFRWTKSGGMVGLGVGSYAQSVSADGSVVVGYRSTAEGYEAFRWSRKRGMVGLGGRDSAAIAVSADGSVIVGESSDGAFIWNSKKGIQNLEDYLSSLDGIRLNGWSLSKATGISADGKTITGFGLNPNGDTEAWIAYIDSTNNTFAYPLRSAKEEYISKLGFLDRWYYGPQCGLVYHPGEDWNSKECKDCDSGDSVFSVSDGIIEDATFYKSWGYVVLIRHEAPSGNQFRLPGGGKIKTVWSQYGHLSELSINPATGKKWKKDDPVSIHSVIGKVGDYPPG